MSKRNKKTSPSSKNNQAPLTELLNTAIENHDEEKIIDNLNRRFGVSTIDEIRELITEGFAPEKRSLAGNFRNTLKKLAKPTRVNNYDKFSKTPDQSEITSVPLTELENT